VFEMDPAHWLLTEDKTVFDLIVVDLPDPDDYVNAKYYTRFFYRALRSHMHARSLLAVQATSAQRSPQAFASVLATLGAADLVTAPYHIAMPTLGEWMFVLAARRQIGPVLRPRWIAGSIAGSGGPFTLSPDLINGARGQVSRLDDPAVLDIFLNEVSGDEP
jgi:spermidine synthase